MRHTPGRVNTPDALTLISLPNIILTPALVAGFMRVLMRHTPGRVNTPDALTSFAAIATMLLITSEQAFCFKPCSVASAFAKAPFVIAFFAPAFIDFIGGNMLLKRKKKR